MLIPPNAVVSIFRATDLDPYGDAEDVEIPLYTDVTAVISYQSRVMQDQASGTPRQITTYLCLLPKGTDVQADDRIMEQPGRVMYNVVGVNAMRDYGFPADVSVSMTRVGG
jgi:hypothetical protein